MALVIDGTASDDFAANNVGTITLTTSDTEDLIVICIMQTGDIANGINIVTSIIGGGLTFTRRGQNFNTFDSVLTTSEFWYARAPNALVAQIFTVTLVRNADTCAMFAFGVNSPDLDMPWDTFFTSRPQVAFDESGASTIPLAGDLITLGNNDLVLGIRFCKSVPGGMVPGSGFTDVGVSDTTNAHIYVESEQVPSESTISVQEGQSLSYWVMFADALTEARSEVIVPDLNPIPNQINREGLFVAVEIDIYDRFSLGVKKVQIVNRGPFFDGDGNQFFPNLNLPILLGTRIAADVYGQRLRGETVGGDISFFISDLVSFLNLDRYHWIGREFRVYMGFSTLGDLGDLSLVYTGVVNDMEHNFITCSLKTSDKSNLINKPLLTEQYDDSFPESIRGKIKPKLFGKVLNLEPVLEDEVNLTYRVTVVPGVGDALDDVPFLRVGGVNWTRVVGTPGAGEYSIDVAQGTVTLGSVTLGGDVRCDAQVPGWETYYTGDLLEEVILLAGGTIDANSERYFSSNQDDRVGYYTGTGSINVLDLLDDITQRQGGFWTEAGGNGDILYKPLTSPQGAFLSDTYLYLSQVEIREIKQSKLIPAVWRVRPGFKKNWNPTSQFFEGVTDEEKTKQNQEQVVHEFISGLYDNAIKDLDPAAGDILISTLCWEAIPAYFIGSRLFNSWNVERRLFDLTAFCDPNLMEIYINVNLRYSFVNMMGLAHMVTKSIGGGPNQLQVWG